MTSQPGTGRVTTSPRPPGSCRGRTAWPPRPGRGVKQGASQSGDLSSRQGPGEPAQRGRGIVRHVQYLPHRLGRMRITRADSRIPVSPPGHPPADQSLAGQPVQHCRHRCVGVLRQLSGDLAASELATRAGPQHVHDPPLQISEPHRAAPAIHALARVAGAARIPARRCHPRKLATARPARTSVPPSEPAEPAGLILIPQQASA